jgi:hypothetical protein
VLLGPEGDGDLDRWCRRHLGTTVGQVLSAANHLSTVLGVERWPLDESL